MAEQSVIEPSSLDCGLNSIDAGNSADALVVEAEYENVSYPFTQPTNLAAAGRGQLGKKPKPGPKPNIVAMRVAELQERLVSNGSSSKASPSKAGRNDQTGPTPPRPPAAANTSRSTKTDLAAANCGRAQIESASSSDQHLYDVAVRVQLGVLQQISEDTASADVPREMSDPITGSTSGAKACTAAPIYATPIKRAVRPKEEPIYDEAIAVVSAEDDEEPLYDEAIIVHSNRLPGIERTTTSEQQVEPLYADPDDLSTDRSLPARQRSGLHDADLYEEAQPVNRAALIPCTQ